MPDTALRTALAEAAAEIDATLDMVMPPAEGPEAPLLAAMRYAWTKMEPGGIIMCHDWFGNTNLLAAGAIADWMKESGVAISGEQTATSHCWFKKP